MRSYTISTRTLVPTDTQPKRVRVRSEEGYEGIVDWDHDYDGPEVHENAARRVAEVENPGQKVTVQRTADDTNGYTFRVLVG